jgi:hypothetical protein
LDSDCHISVVRFHLPDMSLKVLTFVFSLLSAGLCLASAVHGQSRTAEEPKFQVEIDPAAEGGPKFTVTNLSAKTLGACVFEFSISSEGMPQSHMDWDPASLPGGDERRKSPKPLEPGASMTLNLLHKVGGPFPDKVQVIAGVWTDGETFGVADWVSVILKNRASLASAYEQAISILRQGLDEQWTRDQYLEALNSKPNSLPFHAIRSTLAASQNSESDRGAVKYTMQALLEYFTKNLEVLRKVGLPGKVPSNP